MNKKHILITGASRGIGRALAIKFARNGWNLFLTCKNSEDELCKLKKELEETYIIQCHTFIGDIGCPDDVSRLFDFIYSRADRLDALINNAGISHIGLMTDMAIEEWNHIIQTNLSSAFYTSRLALPPMIRAQKGHIVNISSVWGTTGASCEVAYSASKGGLNTFTKALAKELAPSHIQVNAIACGAINTSMNAFLSAEDIDALKEEIPSGRLGKPEEAASLAYDIIVGPAYLTGQVITLDGGWI